MFHVEHFIKRGLVVTAEDKASLFDKRLKYFVL